MKTFLLTLCLFSAVILTGRAYQANDATQVIFTDGSYLDTSKAVAYATGKGQDGWVVTVGAPGGVYTWTNSLVMGLLNSITIQGASTNNRPTIIFNTSANSGIYSRAYGHLTTIANFIFNVGANLPVSNIIGIDGGGVCFRVSNCEFLSPSKATFGIQVGSINNDPTPGPYGLVDNCQFYFPGGVVYNYLNIRGNGNMSHFGWTQPMSWGTTNCVMVESCSFSQPISAPVSHIVEGDGGARICIRYCNITNLAEGTHGFQSGAHDSTLQMECYENNFVINDSTGVHTMPYLFWQRGGTAVVWSNTIATTSFWNLGKVFEFTVECAESGAWQAESCAQQLLYPADYPGYQQIGQGVVNGAPGPMPIYCWGNVAPGTAYGTYILGLAEDGAFIQQGRDIFTNTPMPGYTALVYPSPLVASGGTVPGSFPTNSPNTGIVIPPTDLQAHPPGNQ
ncbi:MAG: hypothetical protein P4N59_09180 [Negativicutes bacterium]|nr:hypothetical protein [Negativicutes bacterium]